jgi:guanylate kinase
VVAPSEHELERRQQERGSESAQDMAARRRIGEDEIRYAALYDHVVTNDDVDRAVDEILDLVRKARERQT